MMKYEVNRREISNQYKRRWTWNAAEKKKKKKWRPTQKSDCRVR